MGSAVRLLFWLSVLIVAAALALFAISNGETVALGFWPAPYLVEAPLYAAVLVALLLCFLLGEFAAWLAAHLCAALPGGVRRVGLFVDADDPTIAAVLDRAPLDLLQFHGHETPERVAEAKARFRLPVMKAAAIAGPEDVAAALRYEEVADMLLFY